MSVVDPRTTWWLFRETRTRLSKWTLALLRGRRYTIKLEEAGTGYHDCHNRIIQANPQLFKERQPEVQFRATQGILAHECGHAWFTDAWPGKPDEGMLRWLVNVLEDQRIEDAIAIAFPGVAPVIRLTGDLMYEAQEQVIGSAAEQALVCCLVWRWALRRTAEAEMFSRLHLSRGAKAEWSKVRTLVEDSWAAPDTSRVIELARKILNILGVPPGSPVPERLQRFGVGDDVAEGEAGVQEAVPFPTAAFDGDQPGLGRIVPGEGAEGVGAIHKDRHSEPAPYTELEDAARPLANRLVEALKVPTPEVRRAPHAWQGRYNFRQEVRTPDTPHLFPSGMDRSSPRSLALYLLVDRSGSMSAVEKSVREALMAVYLAAADLVISTGIAYFGSYAPDHAVFEVTPVAPRASEEAKALIAGYTGSTNAEFLAWGLDTAVKALCVRPERLKVILVIHDGEPVWKTRAESDWDLSKQRLRQMERSGIIPIGVYIGEASGCERLKLLFDRLVICTGHELPEKLGALLQSLA